MHSCSASCCRFGRLWDASDRAGRAAARTALESRSALDASHEATVRLIDAHANALDVADFALGQDIAEAAHAAVVEVARLLRGRAPSTGPELEYIAERVAMIDQLVSRVADMGRAAQARQDAEAAEARDRDVRAVLEVEDVAGDSALTRLRALDQALDEGPPL